MFRIASLTKAFTAVATLRATAAAGVDLNTPVLEALPQVRDVWRAHPRITIEQLLAQTSGLASTVEGSDVAAFGDGDDAAMATARMVAQHGSSRSPGERWEYYNGNYFVAGAITAQLTGRSYEQALTDLVLTPFGLNNTSFEATAALVEGTVGGRPVWEAGYPRGRRPSGGLISTLDDLLSFASQLLADARLAQVIGRSRTRPTDPMRYGLGWAIGPSGQMYVNGRLPGYRSALLGLPDQGMVVCGLAADQHALPQLAACLNDIQLGITGDDLADAIDRFAA